MILLTSIIWGIPDVVFSGIMGALIAIAGTSLQSYLQRRFDARQRSVEREMCLRRDVYLPAAESLLKFQEYLNAHTHISLPLAEAEPILQELWGKVAQVRLIGSIETIEALDRLNLTFSEQNRPVAKQGFRVRQLAQKREELQLVQKERHERLTQIIELLKQANQTADSNFHSELKANGEALLRELDEVSKEIKRLDGDIFEARLELHQIFAKAITEMEIATAKVLLSIRKEIGFDVDETRFIASIEKTENRIREISREFADEFKREFLSE